MNYKTKLTQQIIDHCQSMNPNEKGYLKQPTDNLIYLENWVEVRNELEDGNGSELKNDGSGKFNAVHSSSALCVNNFAIIKENKGSILFKEYSKFDDASFEKKLPTGISTPNLDFYLESADAVIGFESKFTEYFESKLPNTNLAKYQERKELSYLENGFNQLLQKYVDEKEKMHLDVAQLIKHTIGLIKKQTDLKKQGMIKNISLVYIYWEPTNARNIDICRKHREEIKKFKNDIGKYINFISMTYDKLWEMYSEIYKQNNLLHKLKERYDIAIEI